MAKGVLLHRANSKYDDFPEHSYQFPKRYLRRFESFIGDYIVYYEPRRGGGRMGYKSIAKVHAVVPDPDEDGMFIAVMDHRSYLPLEEFVPWKAGDMFMESELAKKDGSLNTGKSQWSVRPISDEDYLKIIALGFPEETNLLPREGAGYYPGFGETAQDFDHQVNARDYVEQTIKRIPRDRVFRSLVVDAYSARCALTGLCLLNGGGRAEVEAAHIQPVHENGPDTIRNGIALSGTVHWMFDRGLIALTDDLDILVSRQVNDPDQIWSLMNKNRRAHAPKRSADRPHPRFLAWHRSNCFKA